MTIVSIDLGIAKMVDGSFIPVECLPEEKMERWSFSMLELLHLGFSSEEAVRMMEEDYSESLSSLGEEIDFNEEIPF